MTFDDGVSYPWGPLLTFTKAVDVICGVPFLPCENWRDYAPFGLADKGRPFSFRVGDITEGFPVLLSYSDYLEQSGSKVCVSSMYNYAFETSSTHLSDLTYPAGAVVLILLMFALRAFRSKVSPQFSKFGRRVGRNTHGLQWESENEERIVKFGEYVFRLLIHFSISVYGVWYFYAAPWWASGGTHTIFKDYPFQPIHPGMTWYYLFQAAYNLDAGIVLLERNLDLHLNNPFTSRKFPLTISWKETARGDFREMAIHHVITNFLVIGSSWLRATVVGSMVFMVHDISDVPVDLSKLANFLKWKIATICGFVSMVLVWMVTRLGVLPFVIFRGMLIHTFQVVESGNIAPEYYYCYSWVFFLGLGLLILLHFGWFFMFIQMGYVLVTKSEVHDLSEHKNGEKQLDDSTTSSNKANRSNGTSNGENGASTKKKKN